MHHADRSTVRLLLAAAMTALAAPAPGQESPPPMLQWFECRWSDMERRMSDYFVAGYGSVWLPPVSRAYHPPSLPNQNSTSAGYDTFDRFDLGRPGAQTAYGTEATFAAVVEEFQRSGAQVFIDIVLNHNAARQTSIGFQQDGGYPGFWMASTTPITTKQPTSNWGDFHAGVPGGYLQSEDPGAPNYCLLRGDLVALIDIDPSTNHQFIRQPAEAGNPLNLPGGTYFNRVDPNNRRFYPDAALGTQVVTNPGMWFAGPLNSGIFAPPCDVPARNEPASQLTLGRFNLADPMAGDPVPENALGYMLRWVQWMLDVHKVDGFRIDAAKHLPSWVFDTFFDTVVHERRTTPDGRRVTPFSFVESVESNDFTFDRYIRKPNGRASGRFAAGDAYGNRDALDLNGAGALRDIVGAGGLGAWSNVLNAMIDQTDDGFHNGTIGVNHIFSHDNGSAGNGGSAPPTPTTRQQGYFAHAFLVMHPGQAKLYHNARGVARSSGFHPRAGLTAAFGVEPSSNVENTAIIDLVRISNWVARGQFTPRWQDNDVLIFERRTPTGGGAFSGNALVVLNDRYDAGFDQRTVSTSFPVGTRLIELTGNAASATFDPNDDIAEVLTVGAGGQVTVRAPRNAVQPTGGSAVETHRGYLVYAPALPAGTLTIDGASGALPAETFTTPSWRRRTFAVPVVSGPTFDIALTTINGDPGGGSTANADDNAVFRIDAGYRDFNGNGVVDIDHTNAVVPGYEQFVTLRQPLAGTSNTNGLYRQTISTALLDEGMHYVSVVAFRRRNANEAPLFREFRTGVYVDRLDPQAMLVNPSPLPVGTAQFLFRAKALDRTVSRIHLIANPPSVGDPLTLATPSNLATQDDRFDWSRTLSGLSTGLNRVLLCAFEESGRGVAQFYDVWVGEPPCDPDFNQDGNVDQDDIACLAQVVAGDASCSGADPDFNADGNVDQDDVDALAQVVAGGACP
jgi:glycosidase